MATAPKPAATKEEMCYGPGQPHCGVCKFFHGDDDNGTCDIVMGKISEDMWCKAFTREREATLAEAGPDGY